jgi:hypothetical protein
VEAGQITIQSGNQQQSSADPLVLDLNGNGIDLTKLSDGAKFDINGDGKPEQTSFVAPGNGLLAVDWNNDGVINSIKELFGNQNGAANGFDELAKYDENKDNKISNIDSIFSKLLVYRELNNDGKGSGSELSSLKDLGIQSISLSYQNVDMISAGNKISQIAGYQKQDGTSGLAGDAWLNYKA